jgi:hypothetical protein
LTYVFALLIEKQRGDKEKKKEKESRIRIVGVVRQELNMYRTFLDNELARFRLVDRNDPLQVEGYVNRFLRELSLLSRHYFNMSIELKAKVFDLDTLMILERVHQFIKESTPNPRGENFEGDINMNLGNIDDGLRAIRNMSNREGLGLIF